MTAVNSFDTQQIHKGICNICNVSEAVILNCLASLCYSICYFSCDIFSCNFVYGNIFLLKALTKMPFFCNIINLRVVHMLVSSEDIQNTSVLIIFLLFFIYHVYLRLECLTPSTFNLAVRILISKLFSVVEISSESQIDSYLSL